MTPRASFVQRSDWLFRRHSVNEYILLEFLFLLERGSIRQAALVVNSWAGVALFVICLFIYIRNTFLTCCSHIIRLCIPTHSFTWSRDRHIKPNINYCALYYFPCHFFYKNLLVCSAICVSKIWSFVSLAAWCAWENVSIFGCLSPAATRKKKMNSILICIQACAGSQEHFYLSMNTSIIRDQCICVYALPLAEYTTPLPFLLFRLLFRRRRILFPWRASPLFIF